MRCVICLDQLGTSAEREETGRRGRRHEEEGANGIESDSLKELNWELNHSVLSALMKHIRMLCSTPVTKQDV